MSWRRAALLALALVACSKTGEAPASSSATLPEPAPSAAASASASASTTATALPSAAPAPLHYGCDAKGYVAPAGAKPVMTVAALGAVLSFTLENRGTAPVCVFTHVATDGEHFDWLGVELTGGGPARSLHFVDDRDKSAPVSVLLAPGERVTKSVDLVAWAKRKVNGGAPIPPGAWTAAVTYDTTRETWVWSGKLTATTGVVVR